MLIIWATVIVGGYVLFIKDGRKGPDDGNSPSGSEVGKAEPEKPSPDESSARQDSQELDSQRAVQRMKLAESAVQAKSARERLRRLKDIQSKWQAKQPSLMSGTVGKRIAASPSHVELVADLLGRDRPSDEQLLKWELQVEELAAPVEAAMGDSKATFEITAEHQKLLIDLGQQLVTSLSEFERQQLLLDAITKETAQAAPASVTLEMLLEERRGAAERALAQQMLAAKDKARLQAEQEQVERLAAMEREIVDAETKRQEGALLADKERIEQQAQQEREKSAEEARLRQAQKEAELSAARDKTNALADQAKRAQLEREFERELPRIQTHLEAFLADGFVHRRDGKKGPASLSFLQGEGALKENIDGITRLLFLGAASNDRPRGALPYYIGGNLRFSKINLQPVEQAQEYLRKYGQVMVDRKLLAP